MSQPLSHGRSPKVANLIALAIEEDIIARQMPVGEPLSTEAELCRRYGASRWAIREALAIVQNDGLVEVRRGRGGGAVIGSAPAQSLAASLCGFLLYAGMGAEQVIQSRQVLEGLLFESARDNPAEPSLEACALLASADSTAYRQSLPAAIYHEVLALSGTTMTGAFALALSKLTFCQLSLLGMETVHLTRPELSFRISQLRFAQLRAFIGKDTLGAYAASAELAEMFRKLVSECRQYAPPGAEPERSRRVAAAIAEIVRPGAEAKAASILASQLMIEARGRALAEGGQPSPLIGSEADLIARYGVPRNVLREAIRILERDGFVRAEQGRSGGIKLGVTDETGIVQRAIRLFRLAPPPAAETDGLERECRLGAIAAALVNADGAEWLSARIAALRAEPGEGRIDRLFRDVARRSGNWFTMIVDEVCPAVRARSVPPALGEDAFLDRLLAAVREHNLPLCRRLVASLYPAGA